MSLIGFRREGGEIEYLEEVQYSEDHLEDDLHSVIRNEPRLVMDTLSSSESIVLGSKLQLPSGKEPDLLTVDKRGAITVIEFKRDKSPRQAITQLFDYASSLSGFDVDEFIDATPYDSLKEIYTEFSIDSDSEFDLGDFERTFEESLTSVQLKLVAYSISDDVRRMTRWLRDAHELKINCVEFDYYRRDDAEMFIPTVIGIDETQEIKEKEESEKRKRYRRFFREVLESFKSQHPGVTNRSASSDHWLTIPIGYSDVELLWAFRGDPGDKSLSVGMNIKFDNSERNRELLEIVLNALDNGEIDISEEIISGEYGDRGYYRFFIEQDVGRLEDAVEDEALKSWAVERMVEFHEGLKPVLDQELS